MSKEKRRVPKLRFPGFTEDWEQRKLSDILVERNEQQVETNEYPLMSFVQGHGVIPKGERYDRSFLVLDQSKKYKRTELGDFIYSSNNLETGSIGINKTGKAVISPVYSIFYGVSIGDSQFIGIMSLLPRFIAKMIRFRQGVVYGQWRIHEKDFLDISILIPSEAERTKITKLILSIEELITLHQRKLNNLKLKKKALLQKLFPKNEERYPELRFPGFTDAWEQRKFKDIAFKRGKISEADLPYVEFEDINSGIGTLNKNISQKVGHKKGLLFEAGDVLFGKLRPYLQNWLLCQFAGIAVGDFWVLQPQNVSSAFLYYLIQSEAYQSVANISSGTKMPRSSWPLVSETLFSIPKYKEANMIGEFFLLIDRTITLHQRKLDHLQLQKKALLQQMFV